MSDPGYGDLYVKINHDLKRVVGTCFVAQVNENIRSRTRGNNVHTFAFKLLNNEYCAINEY
jgi:hypothetical protein